MTEPQSTKEGPGGLEVAQTSNPSRFADLNATSMSFLAQEMMVRREDTDNSDGYLVDTGRVAQEDNPARLQTAVRLMELAVQLKG